MLMNEELMNYLKEENIVINYMSDDISSFGYGVYDQNDFYQINRYMFPDNSGYGYSLYNNLGQNGKAYIATTDDIDLAYIFSLCYDKNKKLTNIISAYSTEDLLKSKYYSNGSKKGTFFISTDGDKVCIYYYREDGIYLVEKCDNREIAMTRCAKHIEILIRFEHAFDELSSKEVLPEEMKSACLEILATGGTQLPTFKADVINQRL